MPDFGCRSFHSEISLRRQAGAEGEFRHYGGMASVISGCPAESPICLVVGWRSPLEASTLCVASIRGSTSRSETANGQVYRVGRARGTLHARGDERERQALGVAGGGNEPQGADRGDGGAPRPPPFVLGGG